MEEITLPKIMNTEDKYNKLIHETNTLQKFEALYMKMLSDDYLDMSEIFTLMKIIERDVILVHKLPEVSTLMDMTETFIKYMIIKDDDRLKKEEQKGKEEQNPTNIKKKKFVLCRAVVVFVLYFRCLNEFCYIFINVQLLWLLHSIGPSP